MSRESNLLIIKYIGVGYGADVPKECTGAHIVNIKPYDEDQYF